MDIDKIPTDILKIIIKYRNEMNYAKRYNKCIRSIKTLHIEYKTTIRNSTMVWIWNDNKKTICLFELAVCNHCKNISFPITYCCCLW